MIGKLSGIVDQVSDDHLLLDVGGVGYLVFASTKTLARMEEKGSSAALLIDTHVREDHIHLYGFAERAEQEWFRLLLTVQGVGARHALSVLSVLEPVELANAVLAQDKAAVSRASGVGPKLAQRVVSELKDKAGNIALAAGTGAAPHVVASGGGLQKAADDAIDALVALGYRRSEAFTAVGKAAAEAGEEAGVETLIKGGLKELAR